MIILIRQVGLGALIGPNMFRHEQERAIALLDRVGLAHLQDELARKLSFGQQKLLEFAAVLMSDLSLVLLDEPPLGLAPMIAQQVLATLNMLRKQWA